MSESSKIKLNIGAGRSNLPGFIPIDAKLGHDATKLDYPDNSVDEVYASHVLEHIHHSKLITTIYEWTRVLKPGGRIRIAVPDFDKILNAYRIGDISAEQLGQWVHGSADEDTDRHRNFTMREPMLQAMRRCGLEKIEDFESEYDDWSKSCMSLNLEGYKRNVRIPERPRVAMVLSTPRIGFMDLNDGIVETARELGWGYLKWGGTEWGKGLTEAILRATKECDPDYFMTLDYDSVFTADDCRQLLQLMQDHPEIGAMYPVEAHRHGDVPLGFDTCGAISYRGEITEVLSGHFGCTIIRRQMLEALPQPWFFSCPDPNTGLWKENNIDADITFWALAGMHGWRIAQANNVQIGHMELCVKWIKPDGIVWQPIQHYRKNGKPPNAVFDGKYWERFQSGRPVAQAYAPSESDKKIEMKPFEKTVHFNGHSPELSERPAPAGV